jgi:hypothetical protein
MYLQDLKPHIFFSEEQEVLPVGWLDKEHDYPKGAVPPPFLERLQHYCVNPAFLSFGYHDCEFCDEEFGVEMVILGKQWRVGSGDLRVVTRDVVYAAPDMIYHYIVDHYYRPPDAFIQAVMELPLPRENPEYLRRYGGF